MVWRMNDGLEVEATLPPDKDAFIAAALAGPGFGATPEFKGNSKLLSNEKY
jgi:hypothetical protein